MNITVKAQDFDLTQSIDEFVRDHLHTALARLDDDIISTSVHLRDSNGPRAVSTSRR